MTNISNAKQEKHNQKIIKIIYGTCGGNTELVCEKVAEILNTKHSAELLKAKLTKPKNLKNYDLLILASPTYGHGQLEQYFAKFFSELKEINLKNKKCAVIGLGDPKYDKDYHLESIKIIMDFLKQKEADIVCMPLRVSKNPLPFLNTHVEIWANKLKELL